MDDFRGKVAAITGAGSGIGRALALALAAEGASLAISDIDWPGLEQTRNQAEALGVAVSTHMVDVSDREQMIWFAEEVVERHGQVDLVVNNAGVVVSETLDDVTYEDFNWLMGVNFWGVVHGTKAFLPHLRQRPEAYLVNVASINGMVAFPNNGPYVASKFAVTGFTESLSQELEGTGIHVSGVYPGGVRTDIVRRAKFYKAAASDMDRDGMIGRFDESAKTSPEEAARVILDGVRRNRPRILIGRDAWVLDWLKRLFPVWTTRWVARKVRELKNTPRS